MKKLSIFIDGKNKSFKRLRVFTELNKYKEISIENNSIDVKGLEYFLNIHNVDGLVLIRDQYQKDTLKEFNKLHTDADLVLVKSNLVRKFKAAGDLLEFSPVSINSIKFDVNNLIAKTYTETVYNSDIAIYNQTLVFNYGPKLLSPASRERKKEELDNIKDIINKDDNVISYGEFDTDIKQLELLETDHSIILFTNNYNFIAIRVASKCSSIDDLRKSIDSLSNNNLIYNLVNVKEIADLFRNCLLNKEVVHSATDVKNHFNITCKFKNTITFYCDLTTKGFITHKSVEKVLDKVYNYLLIDNKNDLKIKVS